MLKASRSLNNQVPRHSHPLPTNRAAGNNCPCAASITSASTTPRAHESSSFTILHIPKIFVPTFQRLPLLHFHPSEEQRQSDSISLPNLRKLTIHYQNVTQTTYSAFCKFLWLQPLTSFRPSPSDMAEADYLIALVPLLTIAVGDVGRGQQGGPAITCRGIPQMDSQVYPRPDVP